MVCLLDSAKTNFKSIFYFNELDLATLDLRPLAPNLVVAFSISSFTLTSDLCGLNGAIRII